MRKLPPPAEGYRRGRIPAPAAAGLPRGEIPANGANGSGGGDAPPEGTIWGRITPSPPRPFFFLPHHATEGPRRHFRPARARGRVGPGGAAGQGDTGGDTEGDTEGNPGGLRGDTGGAPGPPLPPTAGCPCHRAGRDLPCLGTSLSPACHGSSTLGVSLAPGCGVSPPPVSLSPVSLSLTRWGCSPGLFSRPPVNEYSKVTKLHISFCVLLTHT